MAWQWMSDVGLKVTGIWTAVLQAQDEPCAKTQLNLHSEFTTKLYQARSERRSWEAGWCVCVSGLVCVCLLVSVLASVAVAFSVYMCCCLCVTCACVVLVFVFVVVAVRVWLWL